MPSPRRKRRVHGGVDGAQSGAAGLVRHAGILLACVLGGLVLVGVADLVLPLSWPAVVVAGAVIGLATWLPLTVGPRALPDGRNASDR